MDFKYSKNISLRNNDEALFQKNNFVILKLDIVNYPLCEIGFVSNLTEDDYRIIGDKGSFHFYRLSRDVVHEKNTNIKNISPESIPSCIKAYDLILKSHRN